MRRRPPDRVGIAVAGAGLIGRRHVELARASRHCDLVAVVDPAPAAAPVAEAAGVPHYVSLRELLEAEDSTGLGVVVATPNRMHVEHALACVKAGVAVLVEKPIADTVADGKRLADAAEAAGVPLLVGHHRRHSPIVAAARRLVADGTLGRPVAVMGSALYRKPDDYFEIAPWRAQPGGGPILINLIHEVDDLRAICGDIVAVQALAGDDVRGFPVEDTVAITLRFASGALGTFLLSDAAASARSWEHTARENADYPWHADEDCYLVAGTRGSLAVPTMRLRTYSGTPSWWEPFETSVVEVERAEPLALQLEHFCAVVRSDAPPLVTGREAVETLRVTLAIAEATRTGRTISTLP